MREIREDGGGGQINRMHYIHVWNYQIMNWFNKMSLWVAKRKEAILSHPLSCWWLFEMFLPLGYDEWYWKKHGCIHTYLFKVLLTVLEDTQLERGLLHQVWLCLIFLFVRLLCHFTLPPTAQWSQLLQIQAINLGYLQLFRFSFCEAIQRNARWCLLLFGFKLI